MNFRFFFQKGKVFTIPNFMSLFRILLVPVIVWVFLGLKNDGLAIALCVAIALAALAVAFFVDHGRYWNPFVA